MARLYARTYLLSAVWILTLGYVYYLFYTRNSPAGQSGGPGGSAAGPVASKKLEDKLAYYESALSSKNALLESLQRRLSQAASRMNAKSLVSGLSVNGSAEAAAAAAGPSAPGRGAIVEDEPFFEVPSVFSLLPHLNGDRALLQPHQSIGHLKHGATVVLAIPHVQRAKENYLLQTLESLLTNMNEQEKQDTVIVVQVSEPWNITYFHKTCAEVMAKFGDEVKAGHLEVIVPSEHFYPDFESISPKWGDSRERIRWRTKQNLDYAFMMMYCSHIAKYYVQLEDDIIAKSSYISLMKNYAETQEGWMLLEFSQLGFIGKLFKCDGLPQLVEFLLLFYEHKPVDWLLDNFFHVRECMGLSPPGGTPERQAAAIQKNCPQLGQVRKRYRPSLFQHIGYHSSLAGKVQKLQDKDFNAAANAGRQAQDPKVIPHTNPVGVALSSTLKQYSKFSLQNAYKGESVFWALNPQPGDSVTFAFDEPLHVTRYRFVSGDEQHVEDRFYNATVELLLAESQLASRVALPTSSDGYVVVGKFDRAAVIGNSPFSLADGIVPPEVGRVKSLRIVVHEESHNWVILKEILIESHK